MHAHVHAECVCVCEHVHPSWCVCVCVSVCVCVCVCVDGKGLPVLIRMLIGYCLFWFLLLYVMCSPFCLLVLLVSDYV